MIQQQSLFNPPSISLSPAAPKRCRFHNAVPPTWTTRCNAADSSSLSTKPMELERKSGGLGPYTGRDPNVKKPEWLRQKAPQGERFHEIKQSLSHLKLNTVCEEAQCPNIGEVTLPSSIKSIIQIGNKKKD